jgi:hypothetical protein
MLANVIRPGRSERYGGGGGSMADVPGGPAPPAVPAPGPGLFSLLRHLIDALSPANISPGTQPPSSEPAPSASTEVPAEAGFDASHMIDQINSGLPRETPNGLAAIRRATELAGLPNGGLTLSQRTPFPAVMAGGDNTDLPAVLRGADANADLGSGDTANGMLPSWLASAINLSGASAPGVPSFGMPGLSAPTSPGTTRLNSTSAEGGNADLEGRRRAIGNPVGGAAPASESDDQAFIDRARQLSGLPDVGLTLGQQAPFPSVIAGGDDIDLLAVLRGADVTPDAGSDVTANPVLPSWLASAISGSGTGALGVPSFGVPSAPASSETADAQGSDVGRGLVRRVSGLTDGKYFQDDSSSSDSDEEEDRGSKKETDQEEDADNDLDLGKLPRVRGPKLEPGPRPGNPGGNSSRPTRLDKCLRAAQGETDDWTRFCDTVTGINKVVGGGPASKACRAKTEESSQDKIGWCQNQYGPDSRKNQGPTLSSSAFNALRNPPSKRPRPFEADYPDLENDESGERLKFDVNGRSLEDAFKVVGRRTVGGPDENLSPRGIDSVISYLKESHPDNWSAKWSRDYDQRIEQIDKTAPRQRDLINARLLAHMLDDLTRNPWDKELEPEMRQIYNDLNGAKWQRGKVVSRGRQTTPEDFGYKGDQVHREYWQEAIRAALADPNYIKTVAPKVADRLRKSLYRWPVRLNSIEPLVSTSAPA